MIFNLKFRNHIWEWKYLPLRYEENGQDVNAKSVGAVYVSILHSISNFLFLSILSIFPFVFLFINIPWAPDILFSYLSVCRSC